MPSLARKRPLQVQPGSVRVAAKKRRLEIRNYLSQLKGFTVKLNPERAILLRHLELRSKLVVLIFFCMFLLLIGRSAFLATSPYLRMQTALVVSNTEPSAIVALVKHVRRLTDISKNIDKASLGEIQSALDDTKRIAERAAADFQAQYDAWSELRGKIKNDSSTYSELRAQLAEVQRLQEDEVRRLKSMLDAAQRPSVYADAFNLFLSFFLGVLGSLVASAIYSHWQIRRALAGPLSK